MRNLSHRTRLLFAILGTILLCAGFVLLFTARSWVQSPGELEGLLSDYTSYHEQGDIEALQSLVFWEDVSDRTRRIFLFAMQEETRWPIREINYRPFRETDREELLGGVSLPQGVQPQWRLWITLESSDHFTSSWLVGNTPQGLRFLVGG